MTQASRAPGRLHAVAGLAALGIAACPLPAHSQATAAPTPAAIIAAPADGSPAIVAIRLNGQPALEGALVLRAGPKGRDFYIADEEARKLRLVLRKQRAPVRLDRDLFFPLTGVPGIELQFDEAAQVLSLTVAADNFESEQVSLPGTAGASATRTGIGGFLSYDVLAQTSNAAATPSTQNGQFELGVFSPYGVFTTSSLASFSAGSRSTVRLDTTYTIDRPEEMASWRIGDAITRGPGWAPAARFAGVQYATNFGTQPTFITYPLNSMSGRTTLPSVVDVYVNNVLAGTQQVQAGPFTLNELPAIGGQGELRLVVRDLMGREQVLVTNLYGSTTLLKEGLSEVAVQAGKQRRGYGQVSGDYGRQFASAFVRHGFTSELTLEMSGEIARDHGNVSVGGTMLAGVLGEVRGSIAASRRRLAETELVTPAPAANEDFSDRVSGNSVSLGWERRSLTLTLGTQVRVTSPGFRTVGGADSPASRREMAAFGSYSIGSGSLALAYLSVSRLGEARNEFAQLSLSRSFGEWGFLSLTGIRSLSGLKNRQVSLSYALPIDFLTTAGVSSAITDQDRGRETDNRLTLQRALPAGDGYGYRAEISNNSRGLFEGQLQNRVGLYTLGLSRGAGVTSGRLGAAGSLILLERELALGRRIEDAFGMVQVPGFPNVRVYQDNQQVGRTNSAGNAFIPRLRPYQVNRLSIEQGDLPMSAEVMSLKLDATPYFKSGVVVRFAVKETRGGLARFVDESGTNLPPGTVVKLLASGETFPVGEGGLAFLTQLEAENKVRVFWHERSCQVTIRYQATDDPQPDLGTFKCALQR